MAFLDFHLADLIGQLDPNGPDPDEGLELTVLVSIPDEGLDLTGPDQDEDWELVVTIQTPGKRPEVFFFPVDSDSDAKVGDGIRPAATNLGVTVGVHGEEKNLGPLSSRTKDTKTSSGFFKRWFSRPSAEATATAVNEEGLENQCL